MSTVPPLSRRVLAALRPALSGEAGSGSDPTTVARAFAQLEAALDAHVAALAALDRIEDAVVAAHGYPRVLLPAAPGAIPDYAADAATIDRRLGAGSAAIRLKAELRRRQASFASAAEAAGIGLAQAREARTARELSDTAAGLLLTPAQARADLAVKLTVVIAAGEPGRDDAMNFPWVYLRALLADLRRDQRAW